MEEYVISRDFDGYLAALEDGSILEMARDG